MRTWVKVLLVAAVLAVIGYVYMSWLNGRLAERFGAGKAEVQKQWDDYIQLRQAVAIEAGENFRKQEIRDANRATEIEHETRKNETAVAVAQRLAAGAANGLQRAIEASNAAARSRGLPSAASCPTEFARQRDAAIFARQLLGQCGGEYQALAGTTDGVRLKLDSSLKFIGVVAPGGEP